jgi:hypothetical protein
MPDPKRFAFSAAAGASREASSLPFLPLSLQYRDAAAIQVEGLLDTGATVSVMPYRVGLQLGAVWSERAPAVQLTGNLAQFEAQALLVTAQVAEFRPVRLAFAWTRADEVPLLLGQVNFFMEFDVCFYRSRYAFDIRPKNAASQETGL